MYPVRIAVLVVLCIFGLCTAALGAVDGHGMTFLQAVVLGVTEGLTEYLPVSSTGHLYLVSRLLGIGTTPEGKSASDAYVVAIQIGAILAVIWLYPNRVSSMFQGSPAATVRASAWRGTRWWPFSRPQSSASPSENSSRNASSGSVPSPWHGWQAASPSSWWQSVCITIVNGAWISGH